MNRNDLLTQNYEREAAGAHSAADMEYLQQLYPYELKQYQRKVAQALDMMDYEGSMIYDEYPDRFGLERIAKRISMALWEDTEAGMHEKHREYLILVLVYQEVYKRRHGGKRGFYGQIGRGYIE